MQDNRRRRTAGKNVRKERIDSVRRQEMKLRRKRRRKLYFMVIVFFACFIYLSYVILDKKLVDGDEFEAKAITQLINSSVKSEQVLYPNRGSIVDRNMNNIAVSTKVYTVYIDPRVLVNDSRLVSKEIIDPVTQEKTTERIPVLQDTMEKINKILGISIEELNSKYLDIVHTEFDENGEAVEKTPLADNNYQIIATEVSGEKALELEKSGANHVYFIAESKRNYLNATFASSVIDRKSVV